MKKCDRCERPHRAKGLCSRCYKKFKYRKTKGLDLDLNKNIRKLYENKHCVCGEKAIAKNLCVKCYDKTRSKGSKDNKKPRKKTESKPRKQPLRKGCLRKDGYVSIQINGKRYLEHTLLMTQHIRRPLIKGESVHHKNGIRNDNRIENLELWSSSHPSGQRVEDKIKWCKEFLKLYDEM